MADQITTLHWRDTDLGAVPVSDRFDDPYYSLNGGLEETRHVFLDGNDLPERFSGPLHIGELGFGTGLNLLVTWDAWDKAGRIAPLHFTSFEAFPITPQDMARALAIFPQVAGYGAILLDKWQPHTGPVALTKGLTLDVIIGDARDTLPLWDTCADIWFLDGFSPAKNPEMWSDDLISAVGAHTAPHGTAATYSAAGHVRRALEQAGFAVSRTPGYGRKRHMTRARLKHADQ